MGVFRLNYGADPVGLLARLGEDVVELGPERRRRLERLVLRLVVPPQRAAAPEGGDRPVRRAGEVDEGLLRRGQLQEPRHARLAGEVAQVYEDGGFGVIVVGVGMQGVQGVCTRVVGCGDGEEDKGGEEEAEEGGEDEDEGKKAVEDGFHAVRPDVGRS